MPDPTGRVSHLPDMHRGVAWKEPVRVATTASVTISTALNAGDTIDGVTLAAGDRVLVKDQSTGSQNGLYVAGVTPGRAFDMDQDSTTSVPASEVMGAFVYVIAGTANGGKVFKNTNTSAPTIGSTSLTFTEFAGSGLTNPMTTKGDLIVGDTGGTAIRKAVGTDGWFLKADSASTGGIKWDTASGSGTVTTVEEVDGSPTDSAVTKLVFPNGTLSIASHVATYTPAGGGGGGLAHSFIGRNSVGGSWEGIDNVTHPLMKVTLASDSTITAIEAYLRNSSGYHLFYGSAVIYADTSGSPFYPIFASQLNSDTTTANGGSTLDNANPRWVKFACGVWLAAGDYWIGVGHCATDVGNVQIAYDTTGGTEWHITNSYWSQPGQSGASGASSVHNHSIRASILS